MKRHESHQLRDGFFHMCSWQRPGSLETNLTTRYDVRAFHGRRFVRLVLFLHLLIESLPLICLAEISSTTHASYNLQFRENQYHPPTGCSTTFFFDMDPVFRFRSYRRHRHEERQAALGTAALLATLREAKARSSWRAETDREEPRKHILLAVEMATRTIHPQPSRLTPISPRTPSIALLSKRSWRRKGLTLALGTLVVVVVVVTAAAMMDGGAVFQEGDTEERGKVPLVTRRFLRLLGM